MQKARLTSLSRSLICSKICNLLGWNFIFLSILLTIFLLMPKKRDCLCWLARTPFKSSPHSAQVLRRPHCSWEILHVQHASNFCTQDKIWHCETVHDHVQLSLIDTLCRRRVCLVKTTNTGITVLYLPTLHCNYGGLERT